MECKGSQLHIIRPPKHGLWFHTNTLDGYPQTLNSPIPKRLVLKVIEYNWDIFGFIMIHIIIMGQLWVYPWWIDDGLCHGTQSVNFTLSARLAPKSAIVGIEDIIIGSQCLKLTRKDLNVLHAPLKKRRQGAHVKALGGWSPNTSWLSNPARCLTSAIAVPTTRHIKVMCHIGKKQCTSPLPSSFGLRGM